MAFLWVIVTVPLVMIQFNWTLPMHVSHAKEINELISLWCGAFSTSIAFWGLTELFEVVSRTAKSDRLEEQFIQGALKLYNGHVHSLTHEVTQPNEVIPNYLSTPSLTILDNLNQWMRRVAVKLKITEPEAAAGAMQRAMYLTQDLRNLRTDFDPYHSEFSKDFNERINDLLRQLQLSESDPWIHGVGRAQINLLIIRDGLLELVNGHRKRTNQPLMPSSTELHGQH